LRCQAMARRSNEVQAAARLLRPLDADTLRWRALQDARGQLLREGITVRSAGELLVVTSWEVRRSFHGRTNQVDCLVGGRVLRTCSLRTANRLLRG
jgi:hypothetical protein